eukprot:scaffold38158_cov21-Tisochrysis_lutea.AAC.2
MPTIAHYIGSLLRADVVVSHTGAQQARKRWKVGPLQRPQEANSISIGCKDAALKHRSTVPLSYACLWD